MEEQLFDSLEHIRLFLEISTKKERLAKMDEFKKVEPLFKTSLFDVITKMKEFGCEDKLVADFYVDNREGGNIEQVKRGYRKGKPYLKIVNAGIMASKITVVYSLINKMGTKTPIAVTQMLGSNYDNDKDKCLMPETLKQVPVNLLFGGSCTINVQNKKINEAPLKQGQQFQNLAQKYKDVNSNLEIKFLHITREGVMHDAVWGNKKLNEAMWKIVEENAEKIKHEKTSGVVEKALQNKQSLGIKKEEKQRVCCMNCKK